MENQQEGVMTPEEVSAALGAPEIQEEEPIEQPTEPVETDQPQEPQVFDVDGESVTLEQLQAGYMRQSDYTRKTQEVSQLKQIMDAWNSGGPAAKQAIVESLAQEAGITLGQPQQQQETYGFSNDALLGGPSFRVDPNARYDDGSPVPEWRQRGYDSANEMRLHAQQVQMAQTFAQSLEEVRTFIQGQTAEKTRDAEAIKAAKEIGDKYNRTGVTPEVVKDAMIRTGINDPEAAFLKVHGVSLFKQPAAPPKDKPNSPSPTTGRTFDPWRNEMTADEIDRMIRMGYTAVPR